MASSSLRSAGSVWRREAAAPYAPPLRTSMTPVGPKRTIEARSVYAAAGAAESPTTASSAFWVGIASKLAVKVPTCAANGVLVHVGTGAVTVTVALAGEDEPPAPVQVMEYVVVTVGVTEAEPETPLAVKPVPVQLYAFVLLQVSVED